ncbi:MAG: hypothetical protein L3J45_04660 [Flavobacteriaceae bacterium]|nr:hypothetical protein [Flavobacteriaceae bacterium]
MKKISYILGCILVLNLFFSCKSSNLKKGFSFKIASKTYYNWVGGQPGVKGTNVVIKLLKVDLNHFKADSLYFNGKGALIETHIKKDTLVLMAYYNNPIIPVRLKIEPSQKKISKKTPYILKPNEAILTYYDAGIKKVLKLSDVVKTDNKYYP